MTFLITSQAFIVNLFFHTLITLFVHVAKKINLYFQQRPLHNQLNYLPHPYHPNGRFLQPKYQGGLILPAPNLHKEHVAIWHIFLMLLLPMFSTLTNLLEFQVWMSTLPPCQHNYVINPLVPPNTQIQHLMTYNSLIFAYMLFLIVHFMTHIKIIMLLEYLSIFDSQQDQRIAHLPIFLFSCSQYIIHVSHFREQ